MARRPAGNRDPELFDLPLPGWIEPCLPTLVDKPPTGPAWSHEIKWDGYRLSAYVEDGAVKIRTRNGHDWTKRFPTIAVELAKLPVHSAVIDGEAVILDDAGVSHFGALQSALGRGSVGKAAHNAILVAFDLLFLDGHDMRAWSLDNRRDALLTILPHGHQVLRVSEEIEGDADAIYRAACAAGLEGIVCKRRAAPYASGRTRDWAKVKCVQSGTFVVIGYGCIGNSRRLGSLRIAEEVNGQLVYRGRVGSGLSGPTARALKAALDSLAVPKAVVTGLKRPDVTWTEPTVRIEVAYRGVTTDGALRHPVFKKHGSSDIQDQPRQNTGAI